MTTDFIATRTQPTARVLYQVKATRNGQSINLQFVNEELAYDAARALRRRGYEVPFGRLSGLQIEQSLEQAIETAFWATRELGEEFPG